MWRVPAAAVLTASLVVASRTAAAPSRAVLIVSPSAVHRGHLVLIGGSADGCPIGDTVSIISRAFPRTHEFAGVPAMLTKVRTRGLFLASTRIPLRRRVGRYLVTARCGGGNLGVAVRLVVLADDRVAAGGLPSLAAASSRTSAKGAISSDFALTRCLLRSLFGGLVCADIPLRRDLG